MVPCSELVLITSLLNNWICLNISIYHRSFTLFPHDCCHLNPRFLAGHFWPHPPSAGAVLPDGNPRKNEKRL